MTAKKLILSLLSVAEHEQQPVGSLIAAGVLFGLEPSATRMALTRLVKDDLLAAVDRGVYAIGQNSRALQSMTSSWTSVPEKVRPWAGDWLVIQVTHLGRTDKTQLRARERALQLGGLAETSSGLWVRPNNLTATLGDTRARLIELGLDQDASAFVATEFAQPDEQGWGDLWPVDALRTSYLAAIEAMASSADSVNTLSLEEAARETLLIGQSVIRLITLDPLLPPEIIESTDFERVVEDMKGYNALGIRFWKQYFESIA